MSLASFVLHEFFFTIMPSFIWVFIYCTLYYYTFTFFTDLYKSLPFVTVSGTFYLILNLLSSYAAGQFTPVCVTIVILLTVGCARVHVCVFVLVQPLAISITSANRGIHDVYFWRSYYKKKKNLPDLGINSPDITNWRRLIK